MATKKIYQSHPVALKKNPLAFKKKPWTKAQIDILLYALNRIQWKLPNNDGAGENGCWDAEDIAAEIQDSSDATGYFEYDKKKQEFYFVIEETN